MQDRKPVSEFHKQSYSATGYNSRCKDCRNLIKREEYKEDGTYARNYRKKYIREKRGLVREQNRTYRERNKAHVHEYNHNYYIKHKEHLAKYSIEWRERNPEKVKQASLRKVMWRRNAPGKRYGWQWVPMMRFYAPNNVCLSCGEVKDNFVPDHIMPVSKNGTHYIDNIQPLCFSCNSSKKDKTIDYRPDKGAFARLLLSIEDMI